MSVVENMPISDSMTCGLTPARRCHASLVSVARMPQACRQAAVSAVSNLCSVLLSSACSRMPQIPAYSITGRMCVFSRHMYPGAGKGWRVPRVVRGPAFAGCLCNMHPAQWVRMEVHAQVLACVGTLQQLSTPMKTSMKALVRQRCALRRRVKDDY